MARKTIELSESPFDSQAIRVGSHLLIISNKNGEPNIYIADHATIRIKGEPKDDPNIVIGKDEFPTTFEGPISEYEFQQRYD